MKKIYKKYNYEEVIFNNSKLSKLYHIYLHQTTFDKILDILVLFAITFTFIEVLTHLFLHPNQFQLSILHSFSVLVLFIFGLELFREYAVSETKRHFFRKHWLDLILVIFLSFYFVGATYFGIAKFKFIATLKTYVKETKHLRVILKTVGIGK